MRLKSKNKQIRSWRKQFKEQKNKGENQLKETEKDRVEWT